MKKETFEEAALAIIPDKSTPGWIDTHSAIERKGFIKGAEWQAERMYSEEDMIEFAIWVYLEIGSSKNKERTNKELFKEWFEQFKKK